MNRFKRLTAAAIVLLTVFLLPLNVFAAGDTPDAAAEPQESGTAEPEPTALPAPEESLQPAETPTPEQTPVPEETPAPEPSEVPTPEPTQSPVLDETQQPEPTQDPIPTETQEPNITEIPAPEETQTPEPTEIPAPEQSEPPLEVEAVSGDYEYYVLSDGVMISKYKGTATTLTIPRTINGKTVTSIGYYAFDGCTSLVSVTIPNSVTSIGEAAFSSCTKLASVSISNGVTSIGNYAFSGCESLTRVTIPSSVTSIGTHAFWHCTNLKSVNIPNGVKTIGAQTFTYCEKLTSVTIPSSVKSIGEWAFYYCTSLKSVTISNGVKTIGNMAFTDCKSLTSVTIPDSVTKISDYAFAGCLSIKSITIPSSVTSIGARAFYYCPSLASVTIPKSVKSIGNEAFDKCPKVTIKCYKDSYAHKYAMANKLPYSLIISTPAKFTATVKSPTVIAMSWGAVSGANGYDIWRQVGTGKAAIVKTNSAGACTFTDTKAIPGTAYTYIVRAFVTVGKTKYYGGAATLRNVKPTIATPTAFKATVKSPTSIYMSWGAVSGATGYELSRSINGGAYRTIQTSASRVRTETKLTPGASYSYRVRAYLTIGKTKYYSGYAVCKNVKPTVGTPTNFTATIKSPTSASMTWGAVTGASGYELSRSINGGAYRAIQTSASRARTETNLTPGASYSYRVRAYVTIGKSRYYGSWTATKTLKPTVGTPQKLTATKDGTSVSLKWGAVTGATSYELWRSVDGAGYVSYKTLKTNSYTDTNIDATKTYRYKVRACLSKKTGDYSNIVTVEKQEQTPVEPPQEQTPVAA